MANKSLNLGLRNLKHRLEPPTKVSVFLPCALTFQNLVSKNNFQTTISIFSTVNNNAQSHPLKSNVNFII